MEGRRGGGKEIGWRDERREIRLVIVDLKGERNERMERTFSVLVGVFFFSLPLKKYIVFFFFSFLYIGVSWIHISLFRSLCIVFFYLRVIFFRVISVE